jgi:hypothetical protein
LLLGVLQNLLCLLSEMQQVFQAIGGFQPIAGFFQRVHIVHFHPHICSALFGLCASLRSRALRSQMLEFVWLNFDLWSKMSSSAFPLVNYLTHHKQCTIVLLAPQLTLTFVPRNATTIGFDPPVLLARGASRDVTTATLAFKVIGKLIARRHTSVR